MPEFFLSFSLAFFISYVIHAMGIGVGYHRLLAHRSFKCPKAVEYFFVLGGYLGFQSSPLWWATMHRGHHRYSDLPQDPHARLHGWRRAIYGWIFDKTYPEGIDPASQAKDLVDDPIYKILDCNGDVPKAHLLNGFICFLSRFGLLYLFGLPVALGSLAAGLMMQQVTLLFNWVSHIPELGYRSFNTQDDSVNIPWLACLTFGEGFHNNHHARPGSARSGFDKFEIDLNYVMIYTLKRVGLVGWVNDGSQSEPVIASVTVLASEALADKKTTAAAGRGTLNP
ncbi:MAG: acyl-CoA desaturase [Candidatus Obscuribacterales bacterium]|nr:acyl-CoA desaturase [Candidatus Obscuribacterales bacterium]